MLRCVNCHSLIPDDGLHYFVNDMASEIITSIEQKIGHELLDDSKKICESCLMQVTKALPLQDVKDVSLHKGVIPHNKEISIEANICVGCRSSLYKRRTHSIPQGPERNLILERISPKQIPQGGLVCYACWVYVRREVKRNNKDHDAVKSEPDSAADTLLNKNECVCCSRSLSITRRKFLFDGPEKNDIAARISLREIPEGGRVCYACWVSARRNVLRQRQGIPDKKGPSYRRLGPL